MARRLGPDRARQFAATSDCHSSSRNAVKLIIRAHNEALTVVAMCVCDEDCSTTTDLQIEHCPGRDLVCVVGFSISSSLRTSAEP